MKPSRQIRLAEAMRPGASLALALAVVLAVVAHAACSSPGGGTPKSDRAAAPIARATASPAPIPPAAGEPTAAPGPAPASAPAPTPAPPPSSPGPEPTLAGQDFTAEARLIYRMVACGAGELPGGFDAGLVNGHCATVGKHVDQWRQKWLSIAQPFLANLVPQGIPDRVVYPFGGGDLLTALVVYPDAVEYTTISLEAMGDPRPLVADPKVFKKYLHAAEGAIQVLLKGAWNTTIGLNAVTQVEIPGELILDLTGLAVMGYEPVSLRYLRLEPDASIHYLEAGELEVAAEAEQKARRRKGVNDVSTSIWNDAELRFRKAGDPAAPVKVFRHFARNLSNEGLGPDNPIIKHLEAKGKVVAMTKAASFLLWYRTFSYIRDYLLGHMVWMISDSTGVPPPVARAAGFEQVAYGKFNGTYFHDKMPEYQEAFRTLFKDAEDLPFLFGYFDRKFRKHLIVTRPAAAP